MQEKILTQKKDLVDIAYNIWTPTMWKRTNMILTSILISLWFTIVIEFSYWEDFGTYIWYITIAFEFIGPYIEGLIEGSMKETLLIAPCTTGLGLSLGFVGFGADDFKDFLLGHFLDLGLALLQRVYFDTGMEALTTFITSII